MVELDHSHAPSTKQRVPVLTPVSVPEQPATPYFPGCRYVSPATWEMETQGGVVFLSASVVSVFVREDSFC